MNSEINKVPVTDVPNDLRIIQLKKLSVRKYGCQPQFFVRVPGRVNIIGEHIDYCGYPVLPMAIDQDILIAVVVTEQSILEVKNVDDKYVDFNYKISSFDDVDIKSDADGKPFWYNYVLCGIKGALEHVNNKFTKGIKLYVDGTIPPSSGLSSSSALVSASCLSFLYAQGIIPDKSDIASLCARSERYIGTQGGGMDQAIAFLAESGCAQYITWQPLNATPINLPEDAVFVVAHSLAEANKAATNDFNHRVIECRLAAKILAYTTGVNSSSEVITLSQVQRSLEKSLDEMIKLVNIHLSQDLYTKIEISNILNVTEEDLTNLYLCSNTRHLTEFKLRQRALHVYEEAMRVNKFRALCLQKINHNGIEINGGTDENNGDYISDDIIENLGILMSESHFSLKNLYECSHDKLDKLVEISKNMKVHSRLTGAGWGGCIVALCPRVQVKDYIDLLKQEYYDKYCKIKPDLTVQYVFATKPNRGAIIYKSVFSEVI